jgi:hypothetical protein
MQNNFCRLGRIHHCMQWSDLGILRLASYLMHMNGAGWYLVLASSSPPICELEDSPHHILAHYNPPSLLPTHSIWAPFLVTAS